MNVQCRFVLLSVVLGLSLRVSYGEQLGSLKTPWGLVKFSDKEDRRHEARLLIKNWPESGALSLPTPFPHIVRAWLGKDTLPLSFNSDATEIMLHLPEKPASTEEVAIHLLLAEKSALLPDGTVVLSALDASVTGTKAKLESHPGNHRIGFWVNPNDTVEWSFDTAAARHYQVELVYSVAGPDGTKIKITFDDQALEGTLRSTSSWYKYVVLALGEVNVAAGKKHLTRVSCTKKVGGAVMNLKALILTPMTKVKP